MRREKRNFAISIIIMGAACISAQIIILRELLTVFYGNELSLGIILGSWLFLTSLGSIILGRFTDKIARDAAYFSSLLIVLSFMFPASIFLCRVIKPLLGLNPGEIMGCLPVFCSSLAVLCAFCIPYGFLFSLACKIYARFSRIQAEGPGSAFFLEAAGAVIGGTLVSFVLLSRMTSFEIAFLFGLLSLALAFILSRPLNCKRMNFTRYLCAVLLVLYIAGWSAGAINKIDDFSQRLGWRPFNLLKNENSIYAKLTAVSQFGQLSFYSNGLLTANFPDTLGAEEAVHYALLAHPGPKDVLLVGGGINGSLNELYKHNLKSVDYVELDPLLIRMAKDIIGKKIAQQLSNPVLNIIEGDGRFYIKTTAKKYDVIILSVPDPHTARINRLYTMEFFTEAGRRLKEGGILSVSCTASEHYIGPEMAAYLKTIYKTLNVTGFSVKIIPGGTIRFLAFNSKDKLPSVGADFFQEILRERGIETYFVRDYYLKSNLSPERVAYAEDIISDVRRSPVNTDFKPISYYYDIILWATYFQSGVRKFLGSLNERILWYFLLFIYLSIALLYFKREKNRDKAVFIAIGTTGFAEMTIEISTMLAFQIIYGYLYYKLGFIITSFMAGLFIGSYIITKKLHSIKMPLALLKKSKLVMGVFAILLIPVFKILSGQTAARLLYLGTGIIFPLLMLLTGIIGGIQFPLANKIILERKKGAGVGKTAGFLYGVDLIGAMAGALLVSAILVPIIGIFQCLIAAGILNLVSAAVIAPETIKKDHME
ncbi:MAG: fused MFS/spermidine synthase [Candidatus Omnitrophota bacterium]|nr:fused MFS/spermidine synthase [Candidatus Omnitrophota bacterium]